MKKYLMKSVVVGCSLIGLSSPVFAEDVTLTLSHFMSPKSPPHVKFLKPWAEKIKTESKGRLKVEIFPSMTLGGKPPELYRQVRDGAADIVLTITGYTPGVFPRTEVFELPTIHINSAKATTAAIQEKFDLIAKDYKDVKPLLIFANAGNAIHLTDGCINNSAGLKGKKLRTPSRTGGWLIKQWGAEPVGMPVPAIPQALAKGTIDGVLLPFEIMPPYKVHELTNCSLTTEKDGRFGASIFMFAMNKKRYNELPADLKAIIDANSGVALSKSVGELMDEIEAPGKKLQKGTGSPLIELDSKQTSEINSAAKFVIEKWVKEAESNGLDAKKLVEAASSAIAKHSK